MKGCRTGRVLGKKVRSSGQVHKLHKAKKKSLRLAHTRCILLMLTSTSSYRKILASFKKEAAKVLFLKSIDKYSNKNRRMTAGWKSRFVKLGQTLLFLVYFWKCTLYLERAGSLLGWEYCLGAPIEDHGPPAAHDNLAPGSRCESRVHWHHIFSAFFLFRLVRYMLAYDVTTDSPLRNLKK